MKFEQFEEALSPIYCQKNQMNYLKSKLLNNKHTLISYDTILRGSRDLLVTISLTIYILTSEWQRGDAIPVLSLHVEFVMTTEKLDTPKRQN